MSGVRAVSAAEAFELIRRGRRRGVAAEEVSELPDDPTTFEQLSRATGPCRLRIEYPILTAEN